jgi:hypothetical protein
MAAQSLGTVLMTVGTVLVPGALLMVGSALARARNNEQTPVFPRRWRAGAWLIATAAVLLMTPSPGFSDTIFLVSSPLTLNTSTNTITGTIDLQSANTFPFGVATMLSTPAMTYTFNLTINNTFEGENITDLHVIIQTPIGLGYTFTTVSGSSGSGGVLGAPIIQPTSYGADTGLFFQTNGPGLAYGNSQLITFYEAFPQTNVSGETVFVETVTPSFTAAGAVPEPSTLIVVGLSAMAGIAYSLARKRRAQRRAKTEAYA